jgi:hypothetical protein
MRPPLHLTFDAMVALLGRTFERVPDARDPERVKYPMRDAALSAFACFFFQDPSLLAFQRRMDSRLNQNHLATLFQVGAIPSDTQLREILDGTPTDPLRRLLGQIFERYRRSGWASAFKTSRAVGGGLYPVILDGTDYSSSTAIGCAHCLTTTHTKDGTQTTRYRHAMRSATLFRARSHQILPLDAEPIRNTDGTEKQDCELNAAKRLLPRLRGEHPRLAILLLGDALYAHEPVLAEAGPLAMRSLLVVKPGSQPETFAWVEDLEAKGGWVEHGRWSEGPAATRRGFAYRICRQVPVSQERRTWSTFLEVWERDRAGAVVYHNSWVTDLEVTAANVEEVFWLGRGRWKIENEHFNTHKNAGYELEHHFGHGEQTLATVFYFLNLLAFVAHRVLERADALYQQCRARGPLTELWTALRVMVGLRVYASWAELMRHRLVRLERGSP